MIDNCIVGSTYTQQTYSWLHLAENNGVNPQWNLTRLSTRECHSFGEHCFIYTGWSKHKLYDQCIASHWFFSNYRLYRCYLCRQTNGQDKRIIPHNVNVTVHYSFFHKFQLQLGNIHLHIGYLRYEHSIWENPTFKYSFIGGLCGGVALIIIIAIIVVLWVRRKKKLDHLKEELYRHDNRHTRHSLYVRYSKLPHDEHHKKTLIKSSFCWRKA